MDFSAVYYLCGVAVAVIILAFYLLKDVTDKSKHILGLTLLFIVSIALTIVIFFQGIIYSSFIFPNEMEKGLTALVVEMPTKSFFIKTPKGRTCLILRPKNEPIPNPGDKIVFTGETYEIVSPATK